MLLLNSKTAALTAGPSSVQRSLFSVQSLFSFFFVFRFLIFPLLSQLPLEPLLPSQDVSATGFI